MFRLQSFAIMAGLVGLFALMANALFGLFGALLVIGVAAALNWLSIGKAAGFILRLHQARPLRTWEAPHLQSVAVELAARARIRLPQLMVYPSNTPNAFAVNMPGDLGVVALSSQLLQMLDLREASGVLAHEFAHLKNRDGKLNLAAGLFVRAITIVSQVLGFSLLLLWFTEVWGLIDEALWSLLLLVAAAPSVATLLHAALMRARESLADRDAVRLAGDARGLASALYKLHRYGERLDRWRRRFRFIYTADREPGHRLLHTHPAIEDRVQALLDLEKTVDRPFAGKGVGLSALGRRRRDLGISGRWSGLRLAG